MIKSAMETKVSCAVGLPHRNTYKNKERVNNVHEQADPPCAPATISTLSHQRT